MHGLTHSRKKKDEKMKNKLNAKIRQAGIDDAENIFQLIRKNPEELLSRPIADIVQNIDRFLVCIYKENLIGAVSWQILPEIGAPRNPSVEIKSLAVESEFRKMGVGRLLVTSAIAQIEKLHPAQIIALTFTPPFFRKLGFVAVPKEKLMHKIYAGCVNCTKYDSPFTCPEVAMAYKPGKKS